MEENQNEQREFTLYVNPDLDQHGKKRKKSDIDKVLEEDRARHQEALNDFLFDLGYCHPQDADEFVSIHQIMVRLAESTAGIYSRFDLITLLKEKGIDPIQVESEMLYPLRRRPFCDDNPPIDLHT